MRIGDANLRARQPDFRLCAKHIAVQICDPLAAAWSSVEIVDGSLDVRVDTVPKELWIKAHDIRWGIVPEFPIQARLLKLVIERIRFGDIVRIPELSNEVGGAYQPCLPHQPLHLLAES